MLKISEFVNLIIMDSRYQELDKNVVGSGAEALKFLPPNMKALSSGIKEVRHIENVTPDTFRLKHWKDGIRLNTRNISAENLKYEDLYESYRRQILAQAEKQAASGQKQAEFGEFTMPTTKTLLILAGLGAVGLLLTRRK